MAVKLTIPRHALWVGAARLAAAGIADRAGLSIEGIDEVKIIVAEAITYCISHGQPGDPLDLSFELAPSSLTIIVRDPTFSVMRSESAMQLASPGPLGDRGGIFIIESLADRFNLEMDQNNGLTLMAVKRIE